MSQLLEIIKHQLKQLFRNKLTMLATIAVPIVLTLLFSSIQGSSDKVNLYVLDYDKSVYSQELLKIIENGSNIKTVPSTKEQIDSSMKEQRSITVLTIEEGFGSSLVEGKDLKLKMLQNYQSADNIMMENVIEGKAQVFRNIIKDADYAAQSLTSLNANSDKNQIFEETFKQITNAWGKPSKRTVKYETTAESEKQIDWTTQSSIGFMVFFLCFVVIQGIRTFIEEKENRTFTRLLSTPVSYNKYQIGKLVAIFIYGAVQIAALLLLGKFLFNVAWFNNLLGISIILGLYLFALICLGMLFIPFMKTQQQLNNISSLIIVVTSMLGGTFFPLDLAPGMVQNIAKITPQGWAMIGLTDIVMNNNSIAAETETIVGLVSIGMVALVTAMIFARKQLRHERGI